MNEWVNGCMHIYTHGRPDRQEDKAMYGRMDWWEDKCEKGRNI